MSELAVGPVDGAPLLDDVEHGLLFPREQRVHGDSAGGQVLQGANIDQPGPPPVHPVIRHLPQRRRPGVTEPGGHRLVDGLEDQLLHLGGDPLGQWP